MSSVIRGSDNFDSAYIKSVAVIADRKTAGTQGGTATSGSWQTRDLNTEVSDVAGIVTIASNQFTLQAGSYIVDWNAVFYNSTNQSISRIYNITDSAIVSVSISARATSGVGSKLSIGIGYIDITSAKVFELQQRVQTTVSGTGYGLASNAYFTMPYEQYALIKIAKVG
tara:strand:- start:242 stop:748 length:507 start_codon:yes stop_codon:yes gene_type:complete